MLIIGLAGGVASGKSLVASQFQALGAKVLDADSLGHEVLRDNHVVQQLKSTFGAGVVDSTDQLDRRAIASLVFGQSDEAKKNLLELERITHPKISNLIVARIHLFRAEEEPAVILDAAVMFKSGWDCHCDKIVFVKTDQTVRLKRALARGWSEEHFAARESSQTPLDVKLSKATDVIDNNGDSLETNQQIIGLWRKWNLPLPKNY